MYRRYQNRTTGTGALGAMPRILCAPQRRCKGKLAMSGTRKILGSAVITAFCMAAVGFSDDPPLAEKDRPVRDVVQRTRRGAADRRAVGRRSSFVRGTGQFPSTKPPPAHQRRRAISIKACG